MAEQGGISDYSLISSTRPKGGASNGWASLGSALAGGGEVAGENAYNNGLRIGASTADAMAQARDRIQKSQGAMKAAQAMRDPKFAEATGIPPGMIEVMASRSEAGEDPEVVTKMGLAAQQFNHRATLADPNADPNKRLGSALALDPAGAVPKAEGPNGSFISPLNFNASQAPGPGNTPVTVGADQHALVQSEIGAHNATAKATGALATQRDNNPMGGTGGGGGMPKLPTGYMWDTDKDMNSPTYGQVQTSADGKPRMVPNPTAGTGEGTYAKLYHESMVGSVSGASAELKNIMDLGPQESVGLSNVAGHKGVLGVLGTDMGRALSSNEQQILHKSFANLGRFVATAENGGRPPPAGVVTPLQDAIESLPTDTVASRVYGIAQVRQNLEAQLPRVLNGTASPDIKREFQTEIDNLKHVVPFTPQDVRDWMRSPQKDQDIGTYMKGKGGTKTAPAAAGAAPPPGLKLVN